ncbi:MAG: hypothetical protein FH749_09190 [Firmicutes bacterium]|nr:hypothetical protein [Bacillota bacterium]
MEILILFAIGIIWMVIKSLNQEPPKQPQRTPVRPLVEMPEATEAELRGAQTAPKPKVDLRQEEAPLMVEDLDDDQDGGPWVLDTQDVVNGIIMAEILGKPRSRNPHRLMSRRN